MESTQRTRTTIGSTGVLFTLAGIAGIVGPVLFTVILVIAGSQFDGYSQLANQISELGARDSPVGMLQSANFVALGGMLLIFSWGFHQAFAGSDRLTLGLMTYFAIAAAMGNSFFPCDPGCQNVTLAGRLHSMGAATGFLALAAALYILAARMRRDDGWALWARYTRFSSVVSVTLIVVWLVSRDALSSLAGGFQRLMVFAFLQWFVVMGAVLLRR